MPTPQGDFHQPHPLSDKKGFDERYKRAIKECEEGLPPKEAIELAFDIIFTRLRWYEWNKWVIEDISAGFDSKDSNLIKLMLGLAAVDKGLHKRLSKKAIEAAEDGNANMIQFMLKTRYGYSEKTKTDVEITSDDTPIKFEIVNMTPNEGEEED